MWLIIIMLLAVPAVACQEDCEDMGNGVCACDLPANKAVQTFVPSDEKPRREQQREWEVGLVEADMPTSEAANDAKMDADRLEAELKGKKAAGL